MDNMIKIKLDFEKGSTEPERVFDAMSDLIQSVQSLHSCFLNSIITDYKTELLLTDIREGSLESWLSPSVKKGNTNIGKSTNSKLTNFLNISTQKVIEFLEGKETITDISEIDELEEEIKNEAEGLEKFPNRFTLDRQKLVNGLSSIGSATEELHEQDQAFILLPTGTFPINKGFSFSENEAKQLLSEKVDISYDVRLLIIKKADFLGTSMWDFILNKRTVSMKMSDKEWLNKFHHREKDATVHPGDGLRCKYKITISYDRRGVALETKYEIIKVKHKVDTMVEQKSFKFYE